MENNRGYIEKITGREEAILRDLYQLKVMSTGQIKQKYFGQTRSGDNVIGRMRKRRYITTYHQKGKANVYHRIAEKGMEHLRSVGFPALEEVQSLYISPAAVPYALMANDVILKLERSGWTYRNSRRTKADMNLDDGMMIHGQLTDPSGKSYGLYVLNTATKKTTIRQINAEIRDTGMFVGNYIIYASGIYSYDEFVGQAINPIIYVNGKATKGKVLYTGHDLKMLMKGPSLNRMSVYPTDEMWIKALSNAYDFEIVTMSADEKDHMFPIIIRYQGQEMYLADLTQSDLTTAWKLNYYDEHEWKRNQNRPVMVFYFTEKQINIVKNKSDYIINVEINDTAIHGLQLDGEDEEQKDFEEG